MSVSRIVPGGVLLTLLVCPMLMGSGCGSVTVTLPGGDSDGPLVPSAVNTVLIRFVNSAP